MPDVAQVKLDPPKPYNRGSNDSKVDTRIYQISLYFSYMCSCILEHLHAMQVEMNLSSNAATWFRCTGVDPGTITWDQVAIDLCRAFCLADFDQRVRDRLE